MGIRDTVGSTLESIIGQERTNTIRKVERRARNALAKRLAIEQPKKKEKTRSATSLTNPVDSGASAKPEPIRPSRWPSNEPFVPHPTPTMTRHMLLRVLHEKLRPRTYLEIGIHYGTSLALSRTRSIGVDPAFKIIRPIHCDVQLVKAPSDDFFARVDPVGHFDGVPIDLAFIDGMHLSEFALRDFINTEPLMADTGVVVLDDMLPRNGPEADRDRKTKVWTGDVYKVVEILRRRRPDLVVLLVNTGPTGTAVVLGVDQASTILKEAYEEDLEYLLRPDPQLPPQEYLDRSITVEPDVLLASPVWEQLVAHRGRSESADLGALWDQLRQLPLNDRVVGADGTS